MLGQRGMISGDPTSYPKCAVAGGFMGGAGGLLVKRFLRPVEMRTPQPALNVKPAV